MGPVRFAVADRLVRAVAERGPLSPSEAAQILLAVSDGPEELIRALLGRVVDDDARLAWRAGSVTLARPSGSGLPLAGATFCVVDLETTGFAPALASIRELGAVLLPSWRELEIAVEPFGASSAAQAVQRLLSFAGEAVLVGHNLAFDLAFIDHEAARAIGARTAAPVLDTMALARRVLGGRAERTSLAALAELVGAPDAPCHRALADARATAWVLLYLVEAAREQGARTVDDVCALGRIRVRPGR